MGQTRYYTKTVLEQYWTILDSVGGKIDNVEYDWRIYSKRADFQALGNKLGVDPVVARVIRNRDVSDEKAMERFLYGTMDSIPAPSLLRGTEQGAELIERKITEGKKIRIVSDYDVDGVMSCCILLDALRKLGADADYDIPDRIKDGYGINPRIVEAAAADGVDTIITCDNGITAVPAAELAKEKGITFLITDHHEVLENLPPADVMIDPHLPGETTPYAEICGTVVAWKLVMVLAEKIGKPIPREEYLEFLATATVCDVMPLLEENRILVQEGLRKLSSTKNPGFRALIKATGLEGKAFSAYHLGFVIGPAVNAMGRLGSAKRAVELFMTEDSTFADERAEEMKALNDSRKGMTEQGVSRATEILSNMYTEESAGQPADAGTKDSSTEAGWMPANQTDQVIVVYVPELHESLAGIVAGRLKERLWRPVIVLTDSEGDDAQKMLKGSARSIPGYNIFEALTEASDLLDHFGGHPAAAGLTLPAENVDAFRRILNEKASFTSDMLRPKLMIDVPMPMDYVYMRLAEQLEALGPFGTGNEAPVFAERKMELLGARIFGKNRNVMGLRVKSASGRVHELITFEVAGFQNDIKGWFSEEKCDRIMSGIPSGIMLDIAYQVEINEYNGQRSIRFMLKTCRPSET